MYWTPCEDDATTAVAGLEPEPEPEPEPKPASFTGTLAGLLGAVEASLAGAGDPAGAETPGLEGLSPFEAGGEDPCS